MTSHYISSEIRKALLTLLFLLFLLYVSVIISVAVGPVKIPFMDVVSVLWNDMIGKHSNSLYYIIIVDLRLPSTLMAILVGVSLSSAGASVQGIFRNPLVDPYILGISAGAAFGAAFSIVYGIDSYTTFYYLPVSAFAGGVLAVLLVYILSYNHGTLTTSNLIFSGLAIGYLFSAMLSFLMYMSGPHLQELIFWLLGSFSDALWGELELITLPILACVFILFYYGKELNILTGGEEISQATGVDVNRVKGVVIGVSTLLTAIAVSMSGIIGFVGLIIPHIMRRIVGNDYRILIPVSAVAGALLLVISDTLARTLLSPSVIPVGIITSFIGVPFFIYVYKKSSRRMEVSL